MGFTHALLGSSGGIDSAVVQALASAALGGENVHPVLMPSMFSSDHSVNDAETLSKNLGNETITLPIKNIYDQYLETLQPVFAGKAFNLAEENLQARSRAVLLMAISNKMGYILLNTARYTEIYAVRYLSSGMYIKTKSMRWPDTLTETVKLSQTTSSSKPHRPS